MCLWKLLKNSKYKLDNKNNGGVVKRMISVEVIRLKKSEIIKEKRFLCYAIGGILEKDTN